MKIYISYPISRARFKQKKNRSCPLSLFPSSLLCVCASISHRITYTIPSRTRMNANELSRVGCDEERERPSSKRRVRGKLDDCVGFFGVPWRHLLCSLFFLHLSSERRERKKTHTYIQRMSRLVVFMGPDKAGRHLRTACVSGCVNPPLVIYISLFPPVLSPGSPFSPQLDYNLRDKMRLNNEHCLDNVSDTSLLPVTDWLRQQRNDKLRLGNGMSHGAGWWAALRRETHKIVFSRS